MYPSLWYKYKKLAPLKILTFGVVFDYIRRENILLFSFTDLKINVGDDFVVKGSDVSLWSSVYIGAIMCLLLSSNLNSLFTLPHFDKL